MLAGDMLAPGLLIVIAGILLMVAARWANATATALCIVVLLHDAVWVALWYLIYSNASADAVVLHFGPIVVMRDRLRQRSWHPDLAADGGLPPQPRPAGRSGRIRSLEGEPGARPPLVNRALTRSLLW